MNHRELILGERHSTAAVSFADGRSQNRVDLRSSQCVRADHQKSRSVDVRRADIAAEYARRVALVVLVVALRESAVISCHDWCERESHQAAMVEIRVHPGVSIVVTVGRKVTAYVRR